MKKFLLLPFLFSILFFGKIKSQAVVLNCPLTVQEQNQWCWAGCSKCILDYFGDPLQQCTIAEYARQTITWTSFGSVDCCVDPSQGCNYWNYNYGYPGSIADILLHFDNVQSWGMSNDLTMPQISTEINAGRPFVIRWGWAAGGGHFIVGHGINNSTNDVYIMNPWPGEGLEIVQYSWLQTDGNHTWTHTLELTSSPLNVADHTISDSPLTIFPNPFNGNTSVHFNLSSIPVGAFLEVQDVAGRSVITEKINAQEGTIELGSDLSGGIYFVRLINGNEISNAVRIVKTN